jgi:hypothetical protein
VFERQCKAFSLATNSGSHLKCREHEGSDEKFSVLLVRFFRTIRSFVQSSSKRNRISWNQLDFEVPGNGNKSSLKLVVLDIVGIRRFSVGSNNLVRGEQPKKSCVQ